MLEVKWKSKFEEKKKGKIYNYKKVFLGIVFQQTMGKYQIQYLDFVWYI